jgi:hypothetical protein
MRRSGIYIFVLDWRDHPGKDDKWYSERKAKFRDEGLLLCSRRKFAVA